MITLRRRACSSWRAGGSFGGDGERAEWEGVCGEAVRHHPEWPDDAGEAGGAGGGGHFGGRVPAAGLVYCGPLKDDAGDGAQAGVCEHGCRSTRRIGSWTARLARGRRAGFDAWRKAMADAGKVAAFVALFKGEPAGGVGDAQKIAGMRVTGVENIDGGFVFSVIMNAKDVGKLADIEGVQFAEHMGEYWAGAMRRRGGWCRRIRWIRRIVWGGDYGGGADRGRD